MTNTYLKTGDKDNKDGRIRPVRGTIKINYGDDSPKEKLKEEQENVKRMSIILKNINNSPKSKKYGGTTTKRPSTHTGTRSGNLY
jgi:hypothetical protein